MAKIQINNTVRDMTPEEEAQLNASQAAAQVDIQAEKDAKIIADAKLASGKAKLKELGLDDDEITQIIGI